MRASASEEAILSLAWLCPGADALLALARDDADGAWEAVRLDPGALLLVARQTGALPTSFSLSLLHDPTVLEAALVSLRAASGSGAVDGARADVLPVYAAARRLAGRCRRIAEITRLCDPRWAWIGGQLAFLGRFALCTVDPEAARAPGDAADVGRRLARRWQLPPWLAALAGHLGLPGDVAERLGAVRPLFDVVRLAAALQREEDDGPGIEVGVGAAEAATVLGLTPTTLDEIRRGAHLEDETPPTFRDPFQVPLLAEVLRLAAENRRLRIGPGGRPLEAEFDALHDAFRQARAEETERLRALKLNALAEFAAGAGHEINNPLAVISGQAQFLLNKMRSLRARLVESEANGNGNGRHEPEPFPAVEGPDAEAALKKIVEQAQRIYQILRELMQFARPPRPQPETLDLGELVQEVTASLTGLAEGRRVRLAATLPPRPVTLRGDAGQLRTALTCLLRNAVEAAPADGWAGVRVELPSAERVDVIVEDNGAGPPPPQREHLFDPFYSGRAAGRGRGLGLPTAWRLAREHGGDVRYVGLADGPTRFVLSLKASA